MRTVNHMSWGEFNNLSKITESDCFCKGDAYIAYDGSVPKFTYVVEVHEGYGRSNYIWADMDIAIDS